MKETMMLKDLAQIKIFAHPLRARLVEIFAEKPMTAKQAAVVIGQKPTKLYHHVEALERVGLIKLVKTQKKRGTLEKYYRTVAKRFTIDSSVFDMTSNKKEMLGEFRSMFANMLDNTMREISEGISDKLICPGKEERQATLVRKRIRTTPDKIEKINKKIQKLVEEFVAANDKKGDVGYALTLVFYPLAKKKRRR